jgi:hypothetical protein
MNNAAQDFIVTSSVFRPTTTLTSRNAKRLAGILLAALAIAPSGALANKRASSLPAAALSAKTIYVDNQTTDANLQNNAYMALAKWGRFQMADSPQKADIVLRLTGSSYVQSVPSDTPPDMSMASANAHAAQGDTSSHSTSFLPSGYESAPDGFTRLTLFDGKTGSAVWSDLSKTNSPQAATHILDGLREAFDQALKSRDK